MRYWIFVPLLVFCSACIATSTAHAEDHRPNIVILLADDLGSGELLRTDRLRVPTPAIDGLAASGIRMTNGYVTASYCSPSRAGLMTGRYQTRFGHEFNPTGKANLDPRAALPGDESTIANRLADAGYQTALLGKWHLGDAPQRHPLDRGFGEFYGFLHEGHFYVPGPPWEETTSFLRRRGLDEPVVEGTTTWSSHAPINEPPYDENNPVLRGRTPIEEATYFTDALTRESLRFLDEQGEKPFLLMVSYSAVHSPMQAPNASVDAFADIADPQRRVFAAMLMHLDKSVGAILDKLEERKLRDNTLVIFISDNGGPTRELTSSNEPYRGGKGDVYEGGIRVPFIVSWPGTLPSGHDYHHPIIATDTLPTALAAAESGQADPSLDGVNLLPYLQGKREGVPHETLYWRMGDRQALRQGDWKIVRHTRSEKEAGWQLYNLAEDIGESSDLAAKQSEIVERLAKEWNAMNERMVEANWRPGGR
jgi:arylsulfatase B